MLTVEQYISQMKKKDKLDEFNFKNHAENMAAVISYVMEYFNNYLNPETYDYENIKIEQTALKIEQEIESDYPKSKAFIIEYYKKYKSRIDKLLNNWLKGQKYVHLFYSQDDYENAVNQFCGTTKMRNTEVEQYKAELIILGREAKEAWTGKPSISGFKLLDNSLVDWVKETYRGYGVNLFEFAEDFTYSYYKEYVEYVYDRDSERSYQINRYNHRYNNNPFGINSIYEENSHRPFINGRKGELEMLLMYVWLFDDVKDTDYWPEYVNLCVTSGRVSIVNNINIFLPVKQKNIAYPVDIASKLTLAETTNGSLVSKPDAPYILRLSYSKDNDIIWKNASELDLVISNLKNTFANHGVPFALELLSPLRSQIYNEQEFFAQYRVLEKSMKKYVDMKIALVNRPVRPSSKSQYLMQTTEDIVRIRKIAKEMKFKLRFAVDISALVKRKNYRSQFEGDFNNLSEIRSAIIGIHLSSTFSRHVNPIFNTNEDNIHLNKYDYPEIPDFLCCLSALFNDNLCRYFVPEQVDSDYELEELVDDLLRSGFSFRSQERV
jgi:hypothetical protein